MRFFSLQPLLGVIQNNVYKMEVELYVTFGVSPAWFLSLYGDGFTVDQAAESLQLIRDLGFSDWQPEIFREEALEEWLSGSGEKLRSRSEDLGLHVRVFVAHFLGSCFMDERALTRRSGLENLTRLMEVLDTWSTLEVVSVPLPPFHFDPIGASQRYASWMENFVLKIEAFARIIDATGRSLALEAMPGNLAGGSAGLASVCRLSGLEKVGINYDSGHFHAAGESQDLVLARLGNRVSCTHLCDNDGTTNLSLAPGDGTIPWGRVLVGLSGAGYSNSLDIEIRCPADAVSSAYLRGREQLERHMLKESA